MDKYKIIALYGESGAGKDYFLNRALSLQEYKNSLYKIISSTTRPPREGEEDGVTYHFLSNIDFAMQVLDLSMIEAAAFRGWYYGTNINSIKKDFINIGIFNTSSIDILLKDDRFDIVPIYITAPAKVRLIRALERENEPDIDEIIRRYKTDREDFEVFFEDHQELDQIVINNTGEAEIDVAAIIEKALSKLLNDK